MKSFLVPCLDWGGWFGDGLHCERGSLTGVDGYSVSFAWLGLHFEFAIARETRR